MNDLVSYIFRNMDATDKHLIRIYKALVHQNKFNKAVTLFSVVTILRVNLCIEICLSRLRNYQMIQFVS